MSNPLALYDKARTALAAAKRVDEAKDIRDKAVAMQIYAKQAKDRTLVEDATDIRMRAGAPRQGELLAEMQKNKGAVAGRTGRKGQPVLGAKPKLSDFGVARPNQANGRRSQLSRRTSSSPSSPKPAAAPCLAHRIAEAEIEPGSARGLARPHRTGRHCLRSRSSSRSRKEIWRHLSRCSVDVRALQWQGQAAFGRQALRHVAAGAYPRHGSTHQEAGGR